MPAELPALLALRHRVFCVEQGVPDHLEHDEHDLSALHLVALGGALMVGTCRLVGGRPDWRLGRMAVERPWRGRGVGRALLAVAHQEARAAGAAGMVLHAQTHAVAFYAAAGYVARGPEFLDAGIPHREMRLALHPAAGTGPPPGG